MSLIINHNMMAMTAARNLGTHYAALSTSTQRLSSGLRINSAADDAAGLAVSESMKASIAGMSQGVRNAGDALSMLQTADGALSVVDEKLTRMKELAEQSATGTYTTAQRAIMDSEYQAMAAEIDRIANATDFNGVKLLNGSLTGLNSGSGMKIHFGTGNSSAEDYYYIKINDMRATTSTGLQVGGGATADIQQTGSAQGVSYASTVIAAGGFAYYYGVSEANMSGNTLAGIYQLTGASGTIGQLASQINLGTAAKIFGTFTSGVAEGHGTALFSIGGRVVTSISGTAGSARSTIGDGSFIFVSNTRLSTATNAVMASYILNAVNAAPADFWAVSTNGSGLMFIARNPGIVGNNLSATENNAAFTFAGVNNNTDTALSGGGQIWAVASVAADGSGKFGLTLTGNDRGTNFDVQVANPNGLVTQVTNVKGGDYVPANWVVQQDNSGSGGWDGADILTQSGAQLALGQIDRAINTKDTQRAALGATSNRLNNTITNLQIQGENLQAAQSRIADVDVATEMTSFTRNSILTQAATAMLAQANALPRLALQLLGGGGGV
jgi:flagellin